jgi:hypothetical protein
MTRGKSIGFRFHQTWVQVQIPEHQLCDVHRLLNFSQTFFCDPSPLGDVVRIKECRVVQ